MLQAVKEIDLDKFDPAKQHTLAGTVTVSGKGLLLGEEVTTTIQPAPVYQIYLEK